MNEFNFGEKFDRVIAARVASIAVDAKAEEEKHLQKQAQQNIALQRASEVNIFQSDVAGLVRRRAVQFTQALAGKGYTPKKVMIPIDRDRAESYGFLGRKTRNVKKVKGELMWERVTIARVGTLVVSHESANCWSDDTYPVKRFDLDYLLDLDLKSGLIARKTTTIPASGAQIAPDWAINPKVGRAENSGVLNRYENLLVLLGANLLTNETLPSPIEIIRNGSVPYPVRQVDWRDNLLLPIIKMPSKP